MKRAIRSLPLRSRNLRTRANETQGEKCIVDFESRALPVRVTLSRLTGHLRKGTDWLTEDLNDSSVCIGLPALASLSRDVAGLAIADTLPIPLPMGGSFTSPSERHPGPLEKALLLGGGRCRGERYDPRFEHSEASAAKLEPKTCVDAPFAVEGLDEDGERKTA